MVAHTPVLLDEVLAGLITEEGHEFRTVLDVYANHLALTVLSADSPRMFTFIPSAPTKASLLFDMVVSAASLAYYLWKLDFLLFRFIQTSLFLFVPFIMQWSIGSYVSSSGVMLMALML